MQNTTVKSLLLVLFTSIEKRCYEKSHFFFQEAAWQIMLRFYEFRGGAILKEAPKSALRHAFGMNDPLLGKNDNERTLLRTIHQVSESHLKYKVP